MKPELGEGAVMPVGGAAWGSPGPTGRSAGCSSGRCLWTAASSGSPGTAPCWPGAPCSWLPGGTGAVRDALASAYAAAPPGMPALLTPLCPENLQGYVSEPQAANVCPVPCSRGRLQSTHCMQSSGLGCLDYCSEGREEQPVLAEEETRAWPPTRACLRPCLTVGQRRYPEASDPCHAPGQS